MAQSGDVKYGNSKSKEFNLSLAGTGGSDLPDLAEFSDIPHDREFYLRLDHQTQIVLIANFLFAFNLLLIWIGNTQSLVKL